MFELDAPRAERLYQALDRLSAADETHICVPFFSQDEIALMAEQAKTLDFRAATAVVGKGVHQDMKVCFPAPRIACFDKCASLLEGGVNSWPSREDYIPTALHLNDFAVQDYHAGSQGIGIHKDGLRYKYLVFIITLKGQSRLFYTTQRQGGERIAIDDTPGQLVILKAPEFGCFEADKRLLHGVDDIVTGRLSLGFRHEVAGL